jgi:hypothetical protein
VKAIGDKIHPFDVVKFSEPHEIGIQEQLLADRGDPLPCTGSIALHQVLQT